MSSSLNPDQAQCFVMPELGLNYLQRRLKNICRDVKNSWSFYENYVNGYFFKLFKQLILLKGSTVAQW